MSRDSRDSRIAGMDLTSERAGEVPAELTGEQCLWLLTACLLDAEREVEELRRDLAMAGHLIQSRTAARDEAFVLLEKARADIDIVQACRRIEIRLICEQEDKIETLTAERDALAARDTARRVVRCYGCRTEFLGEPDEAKRAAFDHVLRCPEHPMREVEEAAADYHAAWQDASAGSMWDLYTLDAGLPDDLRAWLHLASTGHVWFGFLANWIDDRLKERDRNRRLAFVLQQRLRRYCVLSGLKTFLSADELALYREVFPDHGD